MAKNQTSNEGKLAKNQNFQNPFLEIVDIHNNFLQNQFGDF